MAVAEMHLVNGEIKIVYLSKTR